MISDNKNEFDKSGITKWREITKSFTKSVTVLVLDDNGKPRDGDKVISPIPNDKLEANHKTNVCGVVRESSYHNTRIIAINFFRDKELAISYITAHKDEIDLINCSFSSPNKDDLEPIKDFGIPVICASGNNGNKTWDGLSYPSALEWTISVGAYEERSEDVEEYSNGGNLLDCVAYTDIYIPLYDGDRTLLFNGTSCSAPIVTSMLTYLIAFRKENNLSKINGLMVREYIKNNSVDILDIGKDISSGYGLFKLGEQPMIIKLKINSDVMNINGENVIMDTRPIIDKNNRTLVPLRAISEALGCEVQWNGQTQEITISEV